MDTAASSFDATPEAALLAIRDHRGPVLIDLDETLYLRNSTEDFVGTACPAAVAYWMLKVLDLLRPWRWTGGSVTRDAWRVRLICLLMPWTILLWRRRANALAAEFANQPLLKSLRANDANNPRAQTIVTLGFEQVVRPLLAGLGLANANLIAMSPWQLKQRRQGKLSRVTGEIGESQVRQSLLVTDSLDDRDILEKCARPLRVIWPAARFTDAFAQAYIPGQYLAKVKRPGQQYIYRVILRDDFVFWVLCTLALAGNPITHVFGLGLLLASFWTIYEWGYVDNDRIAERFESEPHLSDAYHKRSVRFSTTLACVWAAGTGLLGLFVLRWPDAPTLVDMSAWACVLLAVAACYLLYNRMDKRSRIWLYALLQLLRAAAFVAVVPVATVGVAAICAFAISRWMPYLHYRTVGGEWASDRLCTSQLLIYCLICITLSVALGWQVLWSFTALSLLGWTIFKARHELKEIFGNAHRIDRLDQTR